MIEASRRGLVRCIGRACCTWARSLLALRLVLLFTPWTSAAPWIVARTSQGWVSVSAAPVSGCYFTGDSAGAPLVRLGSCSSEGELLDLSYKGITSLPEKAFEGMAHMTSLDLRGNKLKELSAGVFSALTALKLLSLSENELDFLNGGVFSGLSDLTELRLDKNHLTTFSPDARVFSGLRALRVLWLSGNVLNRLPVDVFSDLTALENLSLSKNQLGSAAFVPLPPGVFSSLTSLRSLMLSDNLLTQLPPTLFSGLTSLSTLKLYDNNLLALPEGIFFGLITLDILDLSNNKLTTITSGVFSSLTALRSLFLAGNELQCVPVSVAALTALTVYYGPACACEDVLCLSKDPNMQADAANPSTSTPPSDAATPPIPSTPPSLAPPPPPNAPLPSMPAPTSPSPSPTREPPPLVEPASSQYAVRVLVLVVSMPYTTSEFDLDKQEMFELAVALAAETSLSSVQIVSISESKRRRAPLGSRRAGSVDVETQIRAEDAPGTNSLASVLRSGSGESIESVVVKLKESFNREAVKLGLKEATSVAHKSVNGISAEEASGSSAPPLRLSAGAVAGIVCGGVTAVLAIIILVLLYLVKIHRNNKGIGAGEEEEENEEPRPSKALPWEEEDDRPSSPAGLEGRHWMVQHQGKHWLAVQPPGETPGGVPCFSATSPATAEKLRHLQQIEEEAMVPPPPASLPCPLPPSPPSSLQQNTTKHTSPSPAMARLSPQSASPHKAHVRSAATAAMWLSAAAPPEREIPPPAAAAEQEEDDSGLDDEDAADWAEDRLHAPPHAHSTEPIASEYQHAWGDRASSPAPHPEQYVWGEWGSKPAANPELDELVCMC